MSGLWAYCMSPDNDIYNKAFLNLNFVKKMFMLHITKIQHKIIGYIFYIPHKISMRRSIIIIITYIQFSLPPYYINIHANYTYTIQWNHLFTLLIFFVQPTTITLWLKTCWYTMIANPQIFRATKMIHLFIRSSGVGNIKWFMLWCYNFMAQY